MNLKSCNVFIFSIILVLRIRQGGAASTGKRAFARDTLRLDSTIRLYKFISRGVRTAEQTSPSNEIESPSGYRCNEMIMLSRMAALKTFAFVRSVNGRP